jgi:hypothetical protein
VRYLDSYSRGDDGWRIADRNIVIAWSETRPADPLDVPES